jgi:phosphatidylserine/phosphatidylglycerophosphate/cardiolipin synthase-like enzyme
MPESVGPADSLRSLVRRPRILRALRRLDRLIAFGERRIVEGNAVRILPGGKEAFDAVEEAILGARAGIAIEMYTWADDEVGQRMAARVRDRVRAGMPRACWWTASAASAGTRAG